MSGTLHLLRNDWRKSYRYQGGLAALHRCWSGDRILRAGGALPEPEPRPRIDCTVFSVVPEMSALWAVTFERVVRLRPMRVLLGDCSGGLRGATETCLVAPLLNVHHGDKLDLFFDHLCRADVVLVCDDDIFWLDEEPMRWALERLSSEPDVAVVSLRPKRQLSSVLQGKVERAMGSVLIIRRDVWVRERLSFRVVHPPPSEGFGWHYDTGEFAQVELERRGYRVDFGPAELRRHLVDFEGVSSWTLKMQKYRGDLRAAVAGIPVRKTKALATVFVLRGLAELIGELLHQERPPHIVPAPILDRAQRFLEGVLEVDEVTEIHQQVAASMDRLRRRLADLDDARSLGDAFHAMLGVRAGRA